MYPHQRITKCIEKSEIFLTVNTLMVVLSRMHAFLQNVSSQTMPAVSSKATFGIHKKTVPPPLPLVVCPQQSENFHEKVDEIQTPTL